MSKRADISQIEKYLNGKLDATAMHQLEREAQDDPFLMDALEGYEKSGVNHQQLADLQQRLQARVSEKQSRIIPWRMLAIAASVLIALTIGGLWVYNSSPQKQLLTAQADKTLVKPSPLTEAPAIAENKKEALEKNAPTTIITSPKHPLTKKRYIPGYAANNATTGNAEEIMASAPKASEAAKPVKTDSTPLDEALVMDYSAKKKETIAKAGRTDSTKAPSTAAKPMIAELRDATFKNKIRGKIADANGEPLVGVAVNIKNSKKSTVTDSNGEFVFNTDSSKKEILNVSYIGYDPQNLIASNNKPLNITLKPNDHSLAEVMIVGYGTQKKVSVTGAVTTITVKPVSAAKPIAEAHPQNGKEAYDKYINDNAVLDDGKTGTVKIAFIVNTDGTLSDIKVTKSLSDIADKTALDIIKNGPNWVGAANGKPKKVTIKIKFHKAD